MRCGNLYFLLAILLSSCGLFSRITEKKEESRNTANEQTGLKTKTEQQAWKDIHLYQFEQDSLKGTYSLKLWPKGKFVFSPENGLEGDFDSVLMTGTVKRSAIISSKAMINQQEKSKNEKELQLKTTSDSLLKREQKKSFPAMSIVIAGVILIIFAGFWLLKRI